MLLDFEKTEKILKKYDIPLVKEEIVCSKKDVFNFAKKNGFPVVLKLFSPKIVHKTEIKGAVIVDIKDKKNLSKEYEKISILARQKKADVVIQKMERGIHLIIGAKHDPIFGPIIMFGLGGIFAEVFKDVSFRISPIFKKEAQEMIEEIKGYALIKGFRKQEGANQKALIKIILNLSRLLENEKEIKEIDFNPIIANKNKATVVDAKIII